MFARIPLTRTNTTQSQKMYNLRETDEIKKGKKKIVAVVESEVPALKSNVWFNVLER